MTVRLIEAVSRHTKSVDLLIGASSPLSLHDDCSCKDREKIEKGRLKKQDFSIWKGRLPFYFFAFINAFSSLFNKYAKP